MVIVHQNYELGVKLRKILCKWGANKGIRAKALEGILGIPCRPLGIKDPKYGGAASAHAGNECPAAEHFFPQKCHVRLLFCDHVLKNIVDRRTRLFKRALVQGTQQSVQSRVRTERTIRKIGIDLVQFPIRPRGGNTLSAPRDHNVAMRHGGNGGEHVTR